MGQPAQGKIAGQSDKQGLGQLFAASLPGCQGCHRRGFVRRQVEDIFIEIALPGQGGGEIRIAAFTCQSANQNIVAGLGQDALQRDIAIGRRRQSLA